MESTTKEARVSLLRDGRTVRQADIGEHMTIGRSTGSQFQVEDPRASRNHAEISHQGNGRYRLSDAGSANGTWLNGRRLTAPRDLADGDEIVIGSTQLLFSCASAAEGSQETISPGTRMDLRREQVVILVSDIRNYTGMSESLPGPEFSRLIADWFRDCTEIIEKARGTIDKFIGDAVMAYWVADNADGSSPEVDSALEAAKGLVENAGRFSAKLSVDFPGHVFRVGVGLNLGEAMMGNVGTGDIQSFTVVGDSVNLAFRIESLTKEMGAPVVVSRSLSERASARHLFRDLGEAEVKGKKEQVQVMALEWVHPAPADSPR